MNYDELSSFTWDDLSNLTWSQLELDKKQLLNEIIESDAPIPPSVYEKLKDLCEAVNASDVSEEAKRIFTVDSFSKLLDLGKAIKDLAHMLCNVPSLTGFCDALFDALSNMSL